MRCFWTYIEGKNWKAAKKYRVIFLLMGIAFAFGGCLTWLIIRHWALSTWDWMICFIGYPVIISWFIVFLYACNHDFHDGNSAK